MQTLFKFLMVGLTFTVLNVATVAAQADIPAADTSAAPIGEGGEAGGPVAKDMSGNMINDGGHGANSGADYEAAKKAATDKCITDVTKGVEYSEPQVEHCKREGWEQYL